MIQNKLKEYAQLLVLVGLNVQHGDGVVIHGSTEALPLVREVARQCYCAGAKDVITRLTDDDLIKAKYEEGHDDVFDYYPEFEVDYAISMAKNNYHNIFLSGPALALLKDVDPILQQRVRKALLNSRVRFNEEVSKLETRRTLAAVASKAWAKHLYPNMPVEEGIENLWQQIFDVCRLNTPDSMLAWHEHRNQLKARRQWLDQQAFEYLTYKAPGTDLKVYLIEEHTWLGGGPQTKDGIKYIPNMPTEELFTAPNAFRVDGILTATKPLSYMGQIIENFSLEFEKGRVVSCKASNHQELLEDLLNTDDGASRLGEMALVPHSSPISQSGLLFNMTLFDENASCHFALGNAYGSSLKGYQSLTVEERKTKGLNHSMIHVDFMIGGPELMVMGYKKDGSLVEVLVNGEWKIDIT